MIAKLLDSGWGEVAYEDDEGPSDQDPRQKGEPPVRRP